ncbi:hypothetical protein DFH09DRAFT_1392561 [Mycena vulgaris]|nr:hypothetical protein DFH09DRAFT_1392561 [Mycena vulgaris]
MFSPGNRLTPSKSYVFLGSGPPVPEPFKSDNFRRARMYALSAHGISTSHSKILAGAKPAEWLAKPTKWLASRNAGRGRVMPPKSTPTPETSQSARAQATFASQKVSCAVVYFGYAMKTRERLATVKAPHCVGQIFVEQADDQTAQLLDGFTFVDGISGGMNVWLGLDSRDVSGNLPRAHGLETYSRNGLTKSGQSGFRHSRGGHRQRVRFSPDASPVKAGGRRRGGVSRIIGMGAMVRRSSGIGEGMSERFQARYVSCGGLTQGKEGRKREKGTYSHSGETVAGQGRKWTGFGVVVSVSVSVEVALDTEERRDDDGAEDEEESVDLVDDTDERRERHEADEPTESMEARANERGVQPLGSPSVLSVDRPKAEVVRWNEGRSELVWRAVDVEGSAGDAVRLNEGLVDGAFVSGNMTSDEAQ